MKAGIRISGFGGQGIILSGVIVGKAAVFDGFNVVQPNLMVLRQEGIYTF